MAGGAANALGKDLTTGDAQILANEAANKARESVSSISRSAASTVDNVLDYLLGTGVLRDLLSGSITLTKRGDGNMVKGARIIDGKPYDTVIIDKGRMMKNFKKMQEMNSLPKPKDLHGYTEDGLEIINDFKLED